jgi:ppGpp synthetase/RelA/SpoT-type nucleotidyltranferase
MEDMNFNALQISNAGTLAEDRLTLLLKTANMQDICYAYKTRVKPWNKLVQKVAIKRKENGKEDYSLEDITDVLGVRIVTLFRQDMVAVVDKILSLISHKSPFNPIPFIEGELKEAIIFTPSVGNDPVISHVIQKIKSFELISNEGIEERSSAARYSSIHLVAHISQKVPGFEDSFLIPVEIQVRTVFEDAWGEVDHKFGYQSRAGKSDTNVTHPELVEKNLLTLKKFVDSCAEYADNIKDLATAPIAKRQQIKALDTDELVAQNLNVAKVNKSVIKEYLKIRQQRSEAENGDSPKQSFINAAEGFKQLYSQVKENNLINTDDGKKLFRYYIKMDEALCLLSASNFQETLNAIIIYKDLVSEYTNYPVIRFRLGQAYLETSRFELAREQFKRCLTNIKRLSPFDEHKRIVALPDIELARIGVGIHLLLGLAYWKEAEEIFSVNKNSVKVKQYLEQAYYKTENGLKAETISEIQEIKLMNNLLFYALEIVYFKKTNSDIEKFTAAIKKHLKELKPKIDVAHCDNINQLDTLMSSYIYIDKIVDATHIAHRIEKLVVEEGIKGILIDSNILARVNSLLNKEG